MKGEPYAMQEALRANGKCGEQLSGYAYPRFCRFNVVRGGRCRHHMDAVDWEGIAKRLAGVLDFWVPPEEPYDPHTKDKAKQFKNQKWAEACNALDAFKKGKS